MLYKTGYTRIVGRVNINQLLKKAMFVASVRINDGFCPLRYHCLIRLASMGVFEKIGYHHMRLFQTYFSSSIKNGLTNLGILLKFSQKPLKSEIVDEKSSLHIFMCPKSVVHHRFPPFATGVLNNLDVVNRTKPSPNAMALA